MADLRLVILRVNVILITLTLCAVIPRAGRKIFVVGKFGGHDGFIALAAVSNQILLLQKHVNLRISAVCYHILRLSDGQYRPRPRPPPSRRRPSEYVQIEKSKPCALPNTATSD